MAIGIRNKTPNTYKNVVIEAVVTIPHNTRVHSTTASIGTFEWTTQSIHGDDVTGRVTWSIEELASYADVRLQFKVDLNEAKVGDDVAVRSYVVSSQPTAWSVEQTKTVIVVR